jgi:hypothetical protein
MEQYECETIFGGAFQGVGVACIDVDCSQVTTPQQQTTTIQNLPPQQTTTPPQQTTAPTQQTTIPPQYTTTPEGTAPQGTTPQGTTPQGTTPQGTTPQGTTPQGTTPQGTTPSTTFQIDLSRPIEILNSTIPFVDGIYNNLTKGDFTLTQNSAGHWNVINTNTNSPVLTSAGSSDSPFSVNGNPEFEETEGSHIWGIPNMIFRYGD